MTDDYSTDELAAIEAEETDEDWTSAEFDEDDVEFMMSKSAVSQIFAKHLASKELSKEAGRKKNLYEENGVVLEVCELKDCEAKEIAWLWENMLAKGKLNLVFGKAGVGKSYFTSWLASVVSCGAKLPDGKACEKGKVLIINVEDTPEDVIKPRIIAQENADINMIKFVRVKESVFTLEDCASAIKTIVSDDNYALVILDPISAMMGSEPESNNSVRHILAHLNPVLNESTDTCFVLVTHERKSAQNVSSGQDLILGSQGYAAACRVCLRIAEDPDDQMKRIIGVQKENCNMKFKHAYSCFVDETSGKLVFDDRLEHFNMDSLLEKRSKKEKTKDEIEDACDQLYNILKHGPLESEHVKTKMRAAGVSDTAIKKAMGKIATWEKSETDKRKTVWKLM